MNSDEDPESTPTPESQPSPAEDSSRLEPSTQRPSAHNFQRFDCASGDATVLFAAANAARKALEQGQCIVLPTDTVYGIGADAFNPDAVQRLLDAKSRGRDMPPPVLIADANLVRVLAVDVPTAAQDLIDRHWPGPLTVICSVQPSLRLDLGDAEGTIALRVPDHELAREILRQTGPMAVSSANRSGHPAAVSCDEALEQLGDKVAVYLDGGRSTAAEPVPSTIVDFTHSGSGQVLRHGALAVELLRETCPDLEDLVVPAPVSEPVPESPPGGSHALRPLDSVTDPAAGPAADTTSGGSEREPGG